ncbi:uncharacterized protein LAESUDRAFT_52506 [Laetiporus sulphureus 93-53]|uniref:Secreted protein n=1 Tax=Laetiporus sulphureus 93-53 TaxID=1314785 RepID=A0A165FBZ1_9APHY|nr:uncharacterized protein LAESUDRAFT_52506 [Laetiporus sulphureus 93-53]KZT08737.1 hypothetical protein LAESUDRAFT_52506 [Laetiporus sulphureus 93-53]
MLGMRALLILQLREIAARSCVSKGVSPGRGPRKRCQLWLQCVCKGAWHANVALFSPTRPERDDLSSISEHDAISLYRRQ